MPAEFGGAESAGVIQSALIAFFEVQLEEAAYVVGDDDVVDVPTFGIRADARELHPANLRGRRDARRQHAASPGAQIP